MILNQTYKDYCNQIAQLFCKEATNEILCRASVSERLINKLDDYSFANSFLPKLSTGRHYILKVTRLYSAPTGEPKSIMEYTIMDVVTGETKNGWNACAGRMPVYSKVPSMLAQKNLVVVSQNKIFGKADLSEERVAYCQVCPTYGIVYVPGSVGGSGTTGGTTGGGTPGGGEIQLTPEPVQTPTTVPSEAGSGINEIISNPVFLIGGILIAYYLLKK